MSDTDTGSVHSHFPFLRLGCEVSERLHADGAFQVCVLSICLMYEQITGQFEKIDTN